MLGLGRFEFQLVLLCSFSSHLKPLGARTSMQKASQPQRRNTIVLAITPSPAAVHRTPADQEYTVGFLHNWERHNLGKHQQWSTLNLHARSWNHHEVHDSFCWNMYSSLTFVCNVRAAPSTFWRRCAPIWCWKPEGATFTGHCGIMPSLAPWWPGVGSSLNPLILEATVQPVLFPKSYTYNML